MITQQTIGFSQQTIGNQPVIMIENQFANATIALQGAHVLSYQKRDGTPLLWLSDQAKMEAGQAIRGGIPLCFPWFNKHPTITTLPSHGFARNLPWELMRVDAHEAGHKLVFELKSDEQTLTKWPYRFKAQLVVEVGEQLKLTLKVTNTDDKPFEFKFAYHSYFAIQDIHQTQISGLENTEFLDQLKPELGDQLTENDAIQCTAETDRVYHQAKGLYRIVEAGQQDILIQAANCPDAVVWNPWVEKTQRLGDMSAESWRSMVCVECGVMDKPHMLAAGDMTWFKMVLSN